MASAEVHQLAAFATGLLVFSNEDRAQAEATPLPILGALGTAAMTKLPDYLEPATHPNHRQFFHSVAVLAGVGYLTYQTYKWNPETDLQRFARSALLALGTGYLCHLALDACTAKSLPLLGK